MVTSLSVEAREPCLRQGCSLSGERVPDILSVPFVPTLPVCPASAENRLLLRNEAFNQAAASNPGLPDYPRCLCVDRTRGKPLARRI